MRRRWVKLWRRAEDSLIPQAFRWQLFSLLLVRAAHTSFSHRNKNTGQVITLKPGQVAISLRMLSEKLKRPISSVRRDLLWMVDQKMVQLEDMGWVTVATIVNWKLYQNPELAEAEADAAKELAAQVLEDLNTQLKLAGIKKQFRAGSQFKKLVAARAQQDKATLAEFKAVHRHKIREWMGTEWQKFLRPSTLYRASKWPEYLAAAESDEPVGHSDQSMEDWQPKGE